MEGYSDKMVEAGATSASSSEEGGGGGWRDGSPGVPDLTPNSGRTMELEDEMELLLDQVAEVGQGLASIKSGRRKMTNPLSRFSAEAWERKLLQAEEARDKLNRLVTELRKWKVASEGKQEADNVSSFGMFPEEVWERILPNLVDSRDIENVFRAYPFLDGRLMKNRYSWLLDQVVPHIFPWLGRNDVLTCRQVCKRWAHGVDNFLENHPQKRGYDFGSPLTGQVWIPKASRAYYEFGHRFRGVEFNRREQMEQFEQSMSNHPPGKNAFVGRSISFQRNPYYDPDRPNVGADNREFWEEAMEFLCTFGEHVWFIKIYDGDRFFRKEFGQFCDLVFLLLSLLPNLKSFHMPALEILEGSTAEAMETMERSLQSFPHLPQLETLSIPCSNFGSPNVPDCLIKFLVMSSSTTLKRLRLCSCRCKWMVGVGPSGTALLPNLAEFALLKCSAKKIVPVILRSLGAPKLGCLEVELVHHEADFLKREEIVSWSEFFPSLHSLKLNVSHYEYCGDDCYMDKNEENVGESCNLSKVYPDELKIDHSNPDRRRSNSLSSLTATVPSVTSLVVEECPGRMEFDFLKCFPNLEYLKVHCSSLRPRYFETEILCGTGIWEMFHKLKEVTLSYLTYEYRQYEKAHFFRSREEVEWLKQKMSDPIPEGLFENPDSILVRLERSRHAPCSEETYPSTHVPNHLLLTSGDYEVCCVQLGVYHSNQANMFQEEAKWSRDLSWIDALKFLRKYGHHIKRLDFQRDLAGSLAEYYRLVFEVLSLLPNLKDLEMHGFESESDYGYVSYFPADAREFKLLLDQPHVPDLHHLETLSIHGSGLGDEVFVPPGIVKFLVISCARVLKKLDVHRCDWVKIKDFLKLPRLVELKMECFTEKSQVIEAFQSFTAPNLVNLDLHLRKEKDNLVVEEDIISWLAYFPKLITCNLHIWDEDEYFQRSWNQKGNKGLNNKIHEWDVSSLALPSLKSFRLEGCPNGLCFEFLYRFPNLENLELIAEEGQPFFSEDELGGPVIWEKLPKLQKVSAFKHRFDRYEGEADFYRTRAQYESRNGTEAKPDTASILELECSDLGIVGDEEAATEGTEAFEDEDEW